MKRLLAVAVAMIGLTAAIAVAEPANAATQPPTHSLIFNNFSGKCLDLINGDTRLAMQIVQNECFGGAEELWTYQPASGFLINDLSGACATIINQLTNGAELRDFPCGVEGPSNGIYQRWTHRSDGSLLNRDTGKCLIDFGFSVADGGAVGQWDCAPTTDQGWSFF